jgi:hypothetical protein
VKRKAQRNKYVEKGKNGQYDVNAVYQEIRKEVKIEEKREEKRSEGR